VPRQLLAGVAHGTVRAGLHSIGYPLSEKVTDSVQSRHTALILDGVVQQSRDCLILIATCLKHQSAYAHEVGDVRNSDTFSGLIVMKP
jgi:hypothetical protein